MIDVAAPIAISLLLLWAGWKDISKRILPNWVAVAVLCIALTNVVIGQGFAATLPHLAHFGAALVAGMALFAIRWIGGGDGKLYAAVAATAPLQDGLTLLAYTTGFMFVTVLAWFAYSRFRRRNKSSDAAQGDYAKVPLGVAIAAGGIAYLWL